MPWNRTDIRLRVEARAAQLGKSVKDVLPAGYDSFFAPSKTEQSPTIGTLEKIAEALEWSLCELLCDSGPPFRPDFLGQAVASAQRAIPSDRQELLPDAILSAYEYLAALEQDREPFDAAARGHLERLLRVQYKDR